MKTLLTCALVGLFLTLANAQSNNAALPADFQKKLDEASMSFVKPAGVTAVPVIKGDKLNYDYALKMDGKNVEIRYIIRPLPKQMFEMYDNRVKKDGDSVLNPNRIYKIITPLMYSRISGGKLTPKTVSIDYFEPASIKSNAGADVGSMSTGAVGSDWAKGYNFGFHVMLHKDNVADAYIFYLFEDEKQMVDAFKAMTGDQSLFYALKFKE